MRLRGLASLFTITSLLGACGDEPKLRPIATQHHGRHPHGREVRRSCKEAIDGMFALPLEEQFAHVFQTCADLYVELGCRGALRGLDAIAPGKRARYLAGVCRLDYCDKLPGVRPGLCSSDLAQLSEAELRLQWKHFNWQVFYWDLGVGDPLEGIAFRYLEAAEAGEDPAATKGPSLPAPVRITLQQREGKYSIEASRGPTAPESTERTILGARPLADGFSADDIKKWLQEDLSLPRRTPLEMVSAAQGNGLGRLMRGASDAGYVDFTVVP